MHFCYGVFPPLHMSFHSDRSSFFTDFITSCRPQPAVQVRFSSLSKTTVPPFGLFQPLIYAASSDQCKLLGSELSLLGISNSCTIGVLPVATGNVLRGHGDA